MPRVGNRVGRRYGVDQEFDTEEHGRDAGRDMVVELDDYRRHPAYEFEVSPQTGALTPLEDDKIHAEVGEGDFRKNLAEDYDEAFLDSLGSDLIEKLERHIEERRPWRERFERGLEMMGLVESDIDDGPFPGASNAVHPLLIDARTNFWARAMGELFPPDGPAKAKNMGGQTEQLANRGARVSEYMNFDLTIQDAAYLEESSQLVWDLPFYGSCFRKTYHDPVYNQAMGIYVCADDLIVPAECRSLTTTPLFAHRMWKTPNEVKRLQIVGYYRDIDLGLPAQEEIDEVRRLKDETQDVSPDGDDEDNRHEIFEVCIDLDLEGDEHTNEEGEETGLERSYYVTVDKETAKVLSIYRGWDREDIVCKRKIYIEHYKFCPSNGFYGSGFFHLIGGLQIAATGALRVLLDSAASASLSGGFVSRHAALKGKRITFTPGHWEPVDATPEDLQKAFVSPPVKEPSQALFQLIGFLTERGEKFTATTELQTGDADPKNAPVGTTQMLIEQGGKVMSTIHRMMYLALGRELRTRYEIMREYAPADGYPYEVGDGQQRTVYADDFAPGVQIVPVADPNIYSSAQRMAQNQAIYQIASETGVLPMPKVVRRLLQGMRVPDIDQLLPADVQPQAYDPVGEIQALFMGKPVMVTPQQAHVMHLQVLGAFANNPQFGGNEQVLKQIGPQLLSIIGQHMAYAWATHARGLGVPVGYMDPQSGQVGGGGSPEQINAMLAQIAPALATVPGLPAIKEPGSKDSGGEDDLKVKMAELELKREEHQQDMAMQMEKHQFEMAKEQSKLEAQKQMDQQKVAIAGAKAAADQQIAQVQANQKMQQTQMEGQIKQQQAVHQQQMDMQAAERQQAMDQQQMTMQAQTDQQKMHHEAAASQQKMALQKQQGDQQMAQAHQKHVMGQEASLRRQRKPPAPTNDSGGTPPLG